MYSKINHHAKRFIRFIKESFTFSDNLVKNKVNKRTRFTYIEESAQRNINKDT